MAPQEVAPTLKGQPFSPAALSPKKKSRRAAPAPAADARDAAAASSSSSSPSSSEAQKAAHYGLVVNVAMVVLKALGGYLFSSESLLADAFHSATDILADLVTLVTVLCSRGTGGGGGSQQGQGRRGAHLVEGLGSLCVSGFIFTGGAAIALHGLAGMRPYLGARWAWLDALAAGEGEGAGVLDDVPNVLAAWVALASILAKEWVYRITMRIAIQENSAVLRSNAIHHRIDCLSSVVALVTIIGVYLFPTSAWLDPVGAVVISVMVAQAGVESTIGGLAELWPGKGDKDE